MLWIWRFHRCTKDIYNRARRTETACVRVRQHMNVRVCFYFCCSASQQACLGESGCVWWQWHTDTLTEEMEGRPSASWERSGKCIAWHKWTWVVLWCGLNSGSQILLKKHYEMMFIINESLGLIRMLLWCKDDVLYCNKTCSTNLQILWQVYHYRPKYFFNLQILSKYRTCDFNRN